MSDQVEVQEEVLNVAHEALKDVIEWKDKYKEPLEAIPRVSKREQQKDRFLMRSWNIECKSVVTSIKEVSELT